MRNQGQDRYFSADDSKTTKLDRTSSLAAERTCQKVRHPTVFSAFPKRQE